MSSLSLTFKWYAKPKISIKIRHLPFRRNICSKKSSDFLPGLYEDLNKRRLIAQTSSDKLSNFLSSGSRTIYCGFDPTAPSLHLGHLFSLVTLLRFRQFGHETIALIGGATGSIGDPSGRNSERPLLEPEKLTLNQNGLLEQVTNFFENASVQLGLNQKPTLVLNNLDWFGKLSALDFITQTGRHARLSTMLAKDSVKGRLESPQGLSFTEFAYQLVQAHDFWHLHQNYNCQLQVGGQDQWGNIVAGIDLIHKRRTNTKDAFGLTTPLLTSSTGEKIGKSSGNALWLDPALTSPFQFYQYLMKTPDADLESMFLSFTFVAPEVVQEILLMHNKTPELLEGQRRLAQEVTRLVHGADNLASAEAITSTLFHPDSQKLHSMSANELDLAFGSKHAPKDLVTVLPKVDVLNQPIASVVYASGLTKSKSEATRLIRSNGLYLNHERVVFSGPTSNTLLADSALIGKGWGLVLRAGKSNYRVIRLI